MPALFDATSTEAGAIIMEREGEAYIITSHRVSDPKKMMNNDVVAEVLKSGKRKILDIPGDFIIEGALVDFTPRSVWVEPLCFTMT